MAVSIMLRVSFIDLGSSSVSDEPTKREPAKRRRKETGEEGREASVVAERREEGRRAELVPKPPETSE